MMPYVDREAWEVGRDLEGANEEHAAFVARMKSLAKVACDTSHDDETRLRALMTIDAEFWRRRTQRTDGALGPHDKVSIAKRNADKALLLRQKAEAVRRGSSRVWRITGVMHLVEPADGMTCVVCHKPITASTKGRERRYCSGTCRQRAHRAREAA